MAQFTRNTTVALTTTSAQVAPEVSGKLRRVQIIITPVTAGVTATIAKGEAAAVANRGIVLSQNQPFIEATDGGFNCWQGSIQGIASAAGDVSVSETFESDDV